MGFSYGVGDGIWEQKTSVKKSSIMKEMRMQTIKLTKRNLDKAKKLAEARDEKKSKFGHGRHGKLAKSSYNAHYIGLLGEIALGKALNSKIDEKIYSDSGDDGYDFTVGGKTLDVKTSAHEMAWDDPLLKVPCQTQKDVDKLEKSDIFVAVSLNQKTNEVRIWGWVDRETLTDRKPRSLRLRSGGFGPMNYIVGKDEFRPIEDLAQV